MSVRLPHPASRATSSAGLANDANTASDLNLLKCICNVQCLTIRRHY